MRFWIVGAVVVGVGLAGSTAQAEVYPSKPITIVVPYAAGSGMDAISRVVGQRLGEALKQTVIIEDKPGAIGTIGTAAVARAAPDGYTLAMGNTGTHAASRSMLKSLPYDSIKDFEPVGRVGSFVFMVAINSSIPATTLQELATYARANPGKLTYASANVTGQGVIELLKRATGVDAVNVPYKSMPQAVTDLVAGRVSMLVVDRGPALPHLMSHSIRAIMVTTRERSRLLPDVPSALEAGVPDLDLDSWVALFAPAHTPKDIVDRLGVELRKIVEDPGVQKILADAGFEARESSPETVTALIKADLVRWSTMLKAAGVEPQ
jgi:tripartite-type tricarboxylate transporter receptor subunit TctC